MNHALVYLWAALLRRRLGWYFSRLKRPTTLLGFLSVVGLVGVLFAFRNHEVVGKVFQREHLVGAGLVMFCGSLFKGFLQRGLVFELPDVEFVFTGPFTRRQVVLYRLFPSYLFAVIQGAVFLVLFGGHFQHPVLAATCLTLFQVACFHAATAAAIFAGGLPEATHYRLRWMMVGVSFLILAAYLRLEYGFKLAPAWATSVWLQLLFYPAVTLPDVAAAAPLHQLALAIAPNASGSAKELGAAVVYLAGFGALALASLWLMFRLKGDLFEASLNSSTAAAENRRRLQHGLARAPGTRESDRSAALPRGQVFQGMGALVWKNLVVACRSRKELLLAGAFTLVYSGFLIGLLWIYHDAIQKSPSPPPKNELYAFHLGIAIFLAMLTFFLQRMFPFDFRRDGHQLVSFRTLPFSPLAVTLAEVAVPTLLCLASQAVTVGALIYFAGFPWVTGTFLLLAYPAIALALNTVWNIHYLLAATRRAGGKAQSASAVGTLVVVALSFLVFAPAGWTALHIGNYLTERPGFQFAAGSAVLVQYGVDILLVLLLAKQFDRFEITREAN